MRRIPELDAVRGVAALIIVLFHLRFSRIFPVWGSAVDLFFVLSGYLITTIILRESKTPGFFRNFYARRALRILPIYYLTFPFFLLMNPLLRHPGSLEGLPYYLTYTQFIQGYWFGRIPEFSLNYLHTWTLAIEEQFYLIWPLLVWLTGRRFLPLLVAPCLVGPSVCRVIGFFPHLLITRCDGLALGALLAWLFELAELKTFSHKGMRLGFLMVLGVVGSCPLWRNFAMGPIERLWPSARWLEIWLSLGVLRICVFHFALVGLVVCESGKPWLAPLRWHRLIQLGKISYGIYLYHPLVGLGFGLLLQSLGLKGSAWLDLVKVVLCIVVAGVSWRCIEQPILRLKDRFFYSEPNPHAGSVGESRSDTRIPAPHVVASPSSSPAPVKTSGGLNAKD